MNIPDGLTLSRVPILFLIVGLMHAAWPGAATLAFVFFIIAGLTDWLDGALARRWGLVSDFGKLMDALTDKILVVGLLAAIVVYGLAPPAALFLVLLILCREFLITGMRMLAASRGLIIAAEKAGKQKMVTQILAIGFLLAAPVLADDAARLMPGEWPAQAAAWLRWTGLFFLVLASLITATSGLRYFMKYRPQLSGGKEGAPS